MVLVHHRQDGGAVMPSSAKVLLQQKERGIFTGAFNLAKFDGFILHMSIAHPEKQQAY